MTTGSGARHAIRHLLALVLAAGGVAALTVTLHVPTAAAQTDMEKAREEFKRGKRLYENEKYEEAATKFKTAYELSDRSELLYNIGKAYHESGELEKAEEYFQKYLEKNPEASNRQEVLDKVVKIQQQLAAEMGSVEVSAAEGNEVYVDDEEKSRCTTPCTVSLEPGSHELHVRSGDETVGSKSVEVEQGATESIAFEEAPTGPPGKLHVQTEGGGGALLVDGTEEATLPLSSPIEVPPGTRELKVTDASGGEWSGDVSIESGETKRLLVSTSSAAAGGSDGAGGPSTKRTVAYTLAGASVALIGSGLLLGQSARQTHDVLSRQQQQRGAVDSQLLDKGRREMVTANILLGTGTAALLSGAGLFAWDFVGSGGN